MEFERPSRRALASAVRRHLAGVSAWYLSEGTDPRPSRQTATNMLRRYMPELMPTWERLVELSAEMTTRLAC
jgi:hypothetical protein